MENHDCGENPYRRNRKRPREEIAGIDAKMEDENDFMSQMGSQIQIIMQDNPQVIDLEEDDDDNENDDGGDEKFAEYIDDFEQVLRITVDQDMDEKEILETLEVWKNMWVIKDANQITNEQITQRMEKLFPIQNKDGEENLGTCKEYLALYAETLQNLKNVAQKKGLLSTDNEEDRGPSERNAYFELIMNGIIFGYESRTNLLRIKHLANSQCLNAIPPAFESIQRLVFDQNDKPLDDTCKYMKFLYSTAWSRMYRIRNESIYEPKLYNHQYTYAWDYVCDLDHFIWNACQPRALNEEMWRCLASKPTVSTQAYKHLARADDPMLPKLTKSSGWSWTNGVYIGEIDQFYRYNSEEISTMLSSSYASIKFFEVEFKNDEYCELMYGSNPNNQEEKKEDREDGEDGEKNSFDELFDPVELDSDYDEEDVDFNSWMKLPTPKIDKILKDQELSIGVIHWVWVLLGRLLFPVGKHDQWQVMPFFEGIAGSGKSTLLKIIQMFFDPEDVGVITNSFEKEFGAESIYLKKIILGLDIGKKLGVNQMEWQSWVSGEACTIKRKFKTALTIPAWTAPMVYAGNNIPMWTDNAGSVSRRFIIIEMMKAVRDVDTTLFSEVGKNIAVILKKMILAYLSACHTYGNIGIHKVLPKEFLNSANRLRKSTNALYAFVDSKEVITKNPNNEEIVLFQSKESFEAAYQDFCNRKKYPFKRLEPDFVCAVFAQFGIREEHNFHPPGCEIGDYYVGCMLAE